MHTFTSDYSETHCPSVLVSWIIFSHHTPTTNIDTILGCVAISATETSVKLPYSLYTPQLHTDTLPTDLSSLLGRIKFKETLVILFSLTGYLHYYIHVLDMCHTFVLLCTTPGLDCMCLCMCVTSRWVSTTCLEW